MTDSKVNKKSDLQLNSFVLYSTQGCHLCEDALLVLNDLHSQMLALAQENNVSLAGGKVFYIDELDISIDSELIDHYGKQIPVLMFPEDTSELAWPFDIQQAYEFIVPRLVFKQL